MFVSPSLSVSSLLLQHFLDIFLGCLFVSGHTDSRREGVCVMQFGSHYTLFRQDRRTNVRSEIVKASSYESTVCSSFIYKCGSGITCSVQA